MNAQDTPGPWELFERATQTGSATTVWLVRRCTTLPNGYTSHDYLRSASGRVSKFHTEKAARRALKGAIAKATGAAS